MCSRSNVLATDLLTTKSDSCELLFATGLVKVLKLLFSVNLHYKKYPEGSFVLH